MNKKIKSLILSGIICIGILIGNPIKSNALSYGYTTSNLNLRQYAGTYSKKIMTIPKGDRIAIYGSYNNWYSVYVNGKWGYVCKDYVSKGSNNSNSNVSNGKVLNKLIIVNTKYNMIYLYENGYLIWSRPCASGKPSTPTPTGSYYIYNKVDNSNHVLGKCYGSKWMGLSIAHYGIHGTDQPNSIGLHKSNGCIREKNIDINYLYNRVSIGTRVLISAKPVINKTIANWYGYKVY